MILDVLLWLPSKAIGRIFAPVTAMLESLAENASAAAEQYAEDHGIEL